MEISTSLNGVSGVYEIVNTKNGHRYVGSSTNIYRRWWKHLLDLRGNKHHSPYMQRSWNLYGEDVFRFNLLVICEPFEVLRYEQGMMDRLSPEYNAATVAGSCVGLKHTPEARAKISAAHKGRKKSPETCAKMSAANKGKVLSKEHRAKLSAAHTGKVLSEEHKASMSRAVKGRKLSDEHRLALLNSSIGRVMSEETKMKISMSKTGKKLGKQSEDHRAKIGNANRGKRHLGRVVSEETRAKISASHRGKSPSPEVRAKISATLKERAKMKNTLGGEK